MCKFFSFVGDGYGTFLYSNWEQRKESLNNNWDSHTKILTDNKIPPNMQDRWSKYEFNPLTKKFNIDEPVEGHDHQAAENWVNSLDFGKIVEPLIIKPIFNPLTGKAKKVTKKEIALLKEWNSVVDSVGDSVWDFVRNSVWDSVGDSVGDSVMDSVWDSVWNSVRHSVKHSVWDSVWDSVKHSVKHSVWDSVWDSVKHSVLAYVSSFFTIKYKHDFSSCIKLWESGFVPSFDGKTWRLHSGESAQIVYTYKRK